MAITKKNIVIKSKKNKEQLRARDSELVRGIFRYDEVPGGTLIFCYKKYKGDPVISYTLLDGEESEIPRGVAKHLVTTGSYAIHEYQTDTRGNPVVRIGRKKRRYSFESLGFFEDIEDEIKSEESNLFTVEKL